MDYEFPLVFICQFFAPTRFVITYEGDNITEDTLFTKDSSGKVIKVNLPDKLVIMANHQVRTKRHYPVFIRFIKLS